MGGFERVSVSYHQFQVNAGNDQADAPLYTVGDETVQLVGASTLTAFTGLHTGEVLIRAAGLDHAPDDPDPAEWDAGSEVTLWCPAGRILVFGLMSNALDGLDDVVSTGPGLYRIQVRARHRRREDYSGRSKPVTEEYEVLAWPVTRDTRVRTVLVDDLKSGGWSPNPTLGASWAMLQVVGDDGLSQPAVRAHRAQYGHGVRPRPTDRDLRTEVHRSATLASGARAGAVLEQLADWLGATVDGDDLLLPVIGGLQIRLRPANGSTDTTGTSGTSEASGTTTGTSGTTGTDGDRSVTFDWTWIQGPNAPEAVPDPVTSTVEFHLQHHPVEPSRADPDSTGPELTVLHRGVLGRDAVHLGLIWEYLLGRAQEVAEGADVPANPWVERLERINSEAAEAASAADAAMLRNRDEQEAQAYGGRPLTDRVRDLQGNVWGLLQIDRDLVDALAEATLDTQRAVAAWAAHRACGAAGLDRIDWIAEGLDALDRRAPLPPVFDDHLALWNRFNTDDRMPQTVVTIYTGISNFSQQAAALPTIPAAARPDPLVAAVDALHSAASAYGVNYPDLLAAVRRDFPELTETH